MNKARKIGRAYRRIREIRERQETLNAIDATHAGEPTTPRQRELIRKALARTGIQ